MIELTSSEVLQGFVLRPLACQVAREHGLAADGRTVDAIVRDLDRRIPIAMTRDALRQALAVVVQDVIREERRQSWALPVPAPEREPEPEPGRAAAVDRDVPAVAPEALATVVAGEVIEGGRVRPGVADDGRCPVSDLPRYSCGHCRGDDGGDGEEFSVYRELRERIEAGVSREEAVAEVMASLPHDGGPLADAARSWMLRMASKIERAISREAEQAAMARGDSTATSYQRAQAAMRLGDTMFKLPGGHRVRWGSASRADHAERIAWMRSLAAAHRADAEIHDRAVRFIDEHGGRCLDDVPGWEGEIGALPAADPADGSVGE